MTAPRVSVVIVTHDDGAVLGPCLASLARQEVAGGLEIIVVDNASTDETRSVLERHAGELSAILNDHNAYYGPANNQGAELAAGRILLFLNPDTEVVGDDVLGRLADVAEQPDVGIAGPRLVNPDGTLQPSCSAHLGVGNALLVGSGLHRLLPDSLRARLSPEHWSHDRAADTGWVMGAALAIRADVFRSLGGFWSTVFGEEQDLAYRVQQAGLKVRYEPSAVVMHIGNFAFGQMMSRPERARIVAAAEVDFVRRHFSRWRAAAILAITSGALTARALVFSALRRPDHAAVYGAMASVYAKGLRR